MSTYATPRIPGAGAQRGFTLVELMVTVAIAMFLLFGLVTIVQNVRIANVNQQALAQLQDEQRFAMTVITDAIQAGGYFSDPTTYTTDSFPVATAFAPAQNFEAGWVFTGSHTTGALDAVATDTIGTRFQTKQFYGPILCNGTDTSTLAGPTFYQIEFGVDNVNHVLWCMVNNDGNKIQLVTGVTAMAIYYGIKRDTALADYNVDTYVTWDQLNPGTPTDYTTISAVRVVLTFINPMANQANQPPVLTMERVVEVMSRAGQHT